MCSNANLRKIFCGVFLLGMAGCSSLFRAKVPDDAIEVGNQVKIVHDDFKNITFYQGPLVSNTFERKDESPEVEEIRLHARKEHDQTARYYLSVTDYYNGDWRGFDQAFDSSGSKFHAIAVRHKVDCKVLCEYDEELDIEITPDYLREHAQTGITMRLYGPSDVASAPFTLSGAYIQGFLNSMSNSF